MRSHSFKPCHGYQSIDIRGLTDSLSEGEKEPQSRRPFSWPLPSVDLSSFELLQFSAFFFKLTHVFRLCFSAILVSFRFVSLLFFCTVFCYSCYCVCSSLRNGLAWSLGLTVRRWASVQLSCLSFSLVILGQHIQCV